MQVHSSVLFESPERMYARVYGELTAKTPVPAFRVEYRPYTNANSFIQIREGVVTVRITDLLDGAPAPVLEALAFILLSKLLRRPVPAKYNDRYRRYLNRRDVRRNLHLLRQTRGRKQMSAPDGHAYDLVEIFEALNHRHFHGLMARPAIGWSRRRSRTLLGHYDPSHNAIVISRILDDAAIPRHVVEYVVYHEMLHLRFPAEHCGTKRRVHTKAFQEAEKLFPDWEKAKSFLRSL